MEFNLLTERWIPVLRTNGRAERVGIRTALTEAGSIRQFAASNPMVGKGSDGRSLRRCNLQVVRGIPTSCVPEVATGKVPS